MSGLNKLRSKYRKRLSYTNYEDRFLRYKIEQSFITTMNYEGTRKKGKRFGSFLKNIEIYC